MKKKQAKWYSLLLLSLLIAACGVFATPSLPTPNVVGHKPTVDNVRLDKSDILLGDSLKVLYDYQDIDGDIDASKIKWFYNGIEILGKTDSVYIPELNIRTPKGVPCTSFQITAEVTAVSHSGDPFIGESKQTVPVQVALPTVQGFTIPTVTTVTFREAESLCKAKGMQLPTASQLIDLKKEHVFVSNENTLAKKFGWPIYSLCGGNGTSEYWARSTTNPNAAHLVWMDDISPGKDHLYEFGKDGSSLAQTVCIISP